MRIITYISESDSITVKSVLKNKYNMKSSVITALKNTNGILVNGNCVTVRKTLEKGDELKLVIPADGRSENIVPVKGNLDIVYEDEDIICVNKPCGMPTHPSQGHFDDTLANIVCHYFKDQSFRFRVSNRLDNYTSGVVVIAKNMYSASYLCTGDFRKGILKTYYAVCRGIFKDKKGEVVAPISRTQDSTIKRMVSPQGKYACTQYEVVSEKNNNSLVKIMPLTGRTHQIRVHMSYIGHPLVNDFLYDEAYDGNGIFLLHCKTMEFKHPCSNAIVKADTDLPDTFAGLFNL